MTGKKHLPYCIYDNNNLIIYNINDLVRKLDTTKLTITEDEVFKLTMN